MSRISNMLRKQMAWFIKYVISECNALYSNHGKGKWCLLFSRSRHSVRRPYGSVTPTQRTASARKSHSFWPVRCLSLDVRQHSLLVRRARWAYGIYSLSFAVCVELFVHAQNCALSSTHECTHQKDARHARSALDQRQIHAEHSLGIRCMFVG